MTRGKLYLVPAPLDFGCDVETPLQEVLPDGTLRIAAGLSHWICENAKSARAYLKRVDAIVPLAVAIQGHSICELPREVHKKGDHHGQFDARSMFDVFPAGCDVGLLSEAGMPAVADPGTSVVRAAHQLGFTVVPLVGPVSVLLALAASGLNGQNFAFVGYLPQDPEARTRRIQELEAVAIKSHQTQVFIETPYRNAAMLKALSHALQPSTRVMVARGLTLPTAQVRCETAKHWRSSVPDPAAERMPTVFAIGR
ncbi:MAG: SAM-dependent methyltransferase [Gammaproteobacteria bacterium]|nr:SAM-dependent methyltransferase [Gammaproteobacteria bacterium]MBU1442044.1 SAM-dependent methyltransferase [Gammaproteobacteria bacterium]MBU2289228.1 SAM-dependent methyltransferase [Gammaproteobacteria bacterium]MBU2409758.1 SAM-dependent methyltransferase [Gammaproteobacteria bacterium]